MNIKIRQADRLFSEYLRKKIGRCEVCGRKENLQVSHFWGRRSENTRFSEENCDCICFVCHRRFHERPAEYRDWKFKKLGEKRYKLLELAANQFYKRDDKNVIIYLKELIKRQNAIR